MTRAVVVFVDGKQSSSVRRKPHTLRRVAGYITVLSLERPQVTTGLLLDNIQVPTGVRRGNPSYDVTLFTDSLG